MQRYWSVLLFPSVTSLEKWSIESRWVTFGLKLLSAVALLRLECTLMDEDKESTHVGLNEEGFVVKELCFQVPAHTPAQVSTDLTSQLKKFQKHLINIQHTLLKYSFRVTKINFTFLLKNN